MNKKGFTLVELMGVIIILAILSTMAVIAINTVIKNSKTGLYQNLEKTLKGATINYFVDNATLVPAVNGSKNISYTELLSGHYIDEFEDPNGGECSSSYVNVTRTNDKGVNFTLSYKSCVICKDNAGNTHYKTEGC